MNIRKEHLPDRNFGAIRALAAISIIVIHHTGGGIGGLIPTLRENGLSYHYAIEPNGNIIQFAEPTRTAFHARHLNASSVGIAFVGNFTNSEPTHAAYDACIALIRSLYLPNLQRIAGHGEEMATACPAMVNVGLIRNGVFNTQSPQLPPILTNSPQPQPQQVAEWAVGAWRWATEAGITDGTRPLDPAARQEFITMLYRYHNSSKNYGYCDCEGGSCVSDIQAATSPPIPFSPYEQTLLEQLVHLEARGEDFTGQKLVAQVVINRVLSPQFPNTVSEVIHQSNVNSQGTITAQFTPTTRRDFGQAIPSETTKEAVRQALYGIGEDMSRGALFFHAISHLTPDTWHERALTALFDHGNHRFYV